MSWEDRRIETLKNLAPHDVAAFKAKGVGSAGAVIDEYRTSASENVSALAERLGVSESSTAAVIACCCRVQQRRSPRHGRADTGQTGPPLRA